MTRRDVPTPGSTIAIWIVPAGNAGGIGQDHCAFADVLGFDAVRDIDEIDFATKRENHTFHLGHVGAGRAEVGGEGDEGAGHGGARVSGE